MIKITNKPNWGQVLVLVNTGVKAESHLGHLEDQLKRRFPTFKIVLKFKTYALYTLECQYSTEEELYPVLKEYSLPITTNDGFIYAFGIFLSGMYTEKIVLDNEKNAIHVNAIFKASPEEKEKIRKFYDKTRPTYNELLDITNRAIKRRRLNPKVDAVFGDHSALLERAKVKFERDNKGTYESRTQSGHWMFLADGSMSKTDYYTDGRGGVYSFEGIFYDYNPFYEAFEKFFFLLPIDMEKAIKKGWSITIDGRIHYFGPINETEEEAEKRRQRDAALAIKYAEKERLAEEERSVTNNYILQKNLSINGKPV